jgi:hypothetical protein
MGEPMLKELDPEKVGAILDSGRFDDLLCAVENGQIECKAAPYQVENEHQKLELAKDVSALANSGGGVILLGVETERNPTHFGDEIKTVHPFSQGLVNPEQYQSILGSWIYPTLQKVEVRWFPATGTPDKGIVAILIPDQSVTGRPFLLTRMIDDKGKLVQIVFGYMERRRANAVPMSVEELHVLIRDGLRFDSLNEQLENLRLLLEKQTVQAAQPGIPMEKILSGRVEQALTVVGLYDKPAFILAAVPHEAIQIPTLFERRDAPVVRLLEAPPALRVNGFDLTSGASTRIVEGERRRVMTAEDKLLELWRDGTLVFVGAGDDTLLGWGKTTQGGKPIRINQLVLLESTYLFGEFHRRVLEYMEPRPTAFTYSLELRNMTVNDIPCGLIPGPLGTFAWVWEDSIHRAPSSRKRIATRWTQQEILPGLIAFLLVSELYAWFGLEHDKIPYTKKVGEHTEIDPEQIVEAGKR